MSTKEIRAHLVELADEHQAAEALGMSPGGAYMTALEQEIATYRHALIGASVFEIAVLRGVLFGCDYG